jgi:hypothetical protein
LDIGTPSTSPRPSDADSDLERDLALAERELEDEESLQEDADAGGGEVPVQELSECSRVRAILLVANSAINCSCG